MLPHKRQGATRRTSFLFDGPAASFYHIKRVVIASEIVDCQFGSESLLLQVVLAIRDSLLTNFDIVGQVSLRVTFDLSGEARLLRISA